MASIRKRGKSYSVIYDYRDSEGKIRQKWETYKTRSEARKRQKEIEYNKEIGKLMIPRCDTIGDLLKEYVELYGRDKWALSTYESNNAKINNYILPMIGKVRLTEVNPRFLERYYKELLVTPTVTNPYRKRKEGDDHVTTSTIRDIHKILKSCFTQAVKWDLMEKNPAAHATVPKHEGKERGIWTAEVLMYALEISEDPVLKVAINLSFACSLRLGEILGLTWDCVDLSEEAMKENECSLYINKELQRVNKQALKDLDQKDVLFQFPEDRMTCKTVRVLKKPKTTSSIRKVFLPRSVAEMLVSWKEDQEELKEILGEEYRDYDLVLATSFGMPQSGSYIRKKLKQLIRDHDLPEVVFHSFRHTSVTYKLKLSGGDIKSVQGDSGHSQTDMVTGVYSHIIDEDRRRNAELFEEAFYQKKNLDPKMKATGSQDEGSSGKRTMEIPEGVDAELLLKVLNNPEMAALLTAMAKTVVKE